MNKKKFTTGIGRKTHLICRLILYHLQAHALGELGIQVVPVVEIGQQLQGPFPVDVRIKKHGVSILVTLKGILEEAEWKACLTVNLDRARCCIIVVCYVGSGIVQGRDAACTYGSGNSEEE